MGSRLQSAHVRHGWDGHLAVLTDFARVHDGKSELVVREGGAPLTRLERVLIGMSFSFTSVDPREDSLPRSTDFIEQLISKVVNQIDAGSPNGIDDALKEAVDFHSFALEAQNIRDEGGLPVNLAQVNDGPFKRPDFEWLREYRRAYAAAINKMTSDSWFVHGMSQLVVRLWPGDPEAYPSSVLQNILDLGRHQVAIFEAWVYQKSGFDPSVTVRFRSSSHGEHLLARLARPTQLARQRPKSQVPTFTYDFPRRLHGPAA